LQDIAQFYAFHPQKDISSSLYYTRTMTRLTMWNNLFKFSIYLRKPG